MTKGEKKDKQLKEWLSLGNRGRWERFKKMGSTKWSCGFCKQPEKDKPHFAGCFEGQALSCDYCGAELTCRTPGGQSDPFNWIPTNFIAKKIFIICPVRSINEAQRKEIDKYIKQKEKEGYIVHSYKNVNQDDPSGGVNICEHHHEAMQACDEVHVFFDASSSGSHFDFGMAFALDKPIKLIKTYQPTPVGKSYQAVLEKISEE